MVGPAVDGLVQPSGGHETRMLLATCNHLRDGHLPQRKRSSRVGIAPRVPTVNANGVASEMVGQAVEMRKNLSCEHNTGMPRTI